MKAGRLSQTVFRRSVLKQLNTGRAEVLLAPSAEEMCTAIRVGAEDAALMAASSVSGNSSFLGEYAVAKAVNDLATRGAEPVGVSLQLLLPLSVEEPELKELIRLTEELCRKLDIQITGVQAEVTPAAGQTIVLANAVGVEKAEELVRVRNIRAGQDIVLCGYIGLEGMLRILDEREEELGKRFVPAFIHQMKGLKSQMVQLDAIRAARSCKAAAMQQIGSGGIFAALWDMAEAAGVGLEVDMARMSVRQETIEVCEYYHLNPYQMTSAGSILMVTEDSDTLINVLEEKGARAVRLGVTTAENARVITSGQERRFLDRPAPDELMRYMSSIWTKKSE